MNALYQERQDLESDERWRGADESEEAHRGDYGEEDQSHSEKTEEDFLLNKDATPTRSRRHVPCVAFKWNLKGKVSIIHCSKQ